VPLAKSTTVQIVIASEGLARDIEYSGARPMRVHSQVRERFRAALRASDPWSEPQVKKWGQQHGFVINATGSDATPVTGW